MRTGKTCWEKIVEEVGTSRETEENKIQKECEEFWLFQKYYNLYILATV